MLPKTHESKVHPQSIQFIQVETGKNINVGIVGEVGGVEGKDKRNGLEQSICKPIQDFACLPLSSTEC